MRAHSLVAIGGTFDHLHLGHESLIAKAFQYGDSVIIGITSDEFAKKSNKSGIQSFKERSEALRKFLAGKKLLERSSIVPLNDPYGSLIQEPRIGAVIVTDETLPRAEEANKIRSDKGLNRARIYVIQVINAKDGGSISSTRIRNKEIDEKGNLISS
ncbi:MAG: pantetheine-phosphate adenylyltransferase [Candidatus Methanomethylicaceae archaeon]|jgi:pantetheine-phosphate adenylyltransferase